MELLALLCCERLGLELFTCMAWLHVCVARLCWRVSSARRSQHMGHVVGMGIPGPPGFELLWAAWLTIVHALAYTVWLLNVFGLCLCSNVSGMLRRPRPAQVDHLGAPCRMFPWAAWHRLVHMLTLLMFLACVRVHMCAVSSGHYHQDFTKLLAKLLFMCHRERLGLDLFTRSSWWFDCSWLRCARVGLLASRWGCCGHAH
jgi:hypothetical protein